MGAGGGGPQTGQRARNVCLCDAAEGPVCLLCTDKKLSTVGTDRQTEGSLLSPQIFSLAKAFVSAVYLAYVLCNISLRLKNQYSCFSDVEDLCWEKCRLPFHCLPLYARQPSQVDS